MLGDYLKVMEVPLISGRAFTSADVPDGPPVVMINEAAARKYFANEDPIGQRIAFDRVPDTTSVWRTIVGVVGNERQVLARIYMVGDTGRELAAKVSLFRQKLMVLDTEGNDMIVDWLDPALLED